jgi:hypothetical protein
LEEKLVMSHTLTDFVKAVRPLLAPLSPRHRRWQQFLHTLPLDPEQLPLPLASPGPNDFIICGSSRTGTTLLSAVLFQPPSVVTVMEPWDGMRMPPAELFSSLRQEIVETGALSRGKLDLQTLQTSGRVKWQQEGNTKSPLEVTDDFMLGVKWPAFWRYLPLLPETKFLVCLRDPFEVINSFKQVGGRLEQGLQYDIQFNRCLNEELKAATESKQLRRVLLYEYVHSRMLPYLYAPNVFLVRYERWFSEPDSLLEELSAFLGVPLSLSHVRILHSEKPLSLSEAEIAMIGTHCHSARALGYIHC